ncbi:hypothetical protein CDAR_256621 [Caerostris darwini]|uniref:Uncharacterized protein n=1 Tax=Caerostris darwini TaxID=1538125 RepID=A0AAV4PXB8_9ARAC|nr:hypothetical protein CDAR_256621 [Caerostris darwini]
MRNAAIVVISTFQWTLTAETKRAMQSLSINKENCRGGFPAGLLGGATQGFISEVQGGSRLSEMKLRRISALSNWGEQHIYLDTNYQNILSSQIVY